MASARNKAPRGCGEGCPLPTRGEGYASSHMFYFWTQNGKFWRILEANFIAVELSVLHA